MKKLLFIMLVIIFVVSCKTTEKPTIEIEPENKVETLDKNTLKYIGILEEINSNRPKAFSCSMSAKIIADGKRYNALGTGYCKTEPFKIKIILTDNVFRFKMMELAISDGILKAHYTIEKTYVIDYFSQDADKINSTGQNSAVLAALFSGKIPLISGKSEKKVYNPEVAGGVDSNTTLLDIENDKYKQTVLFKNELPEKITVYDKIKNTKYSIKYSNPYRKDGFLFYKNIEIVSGSPYMYLNIRFNNLKIRNNLNDSIFNMRKPSDVKVYDYTKK